MFEHAGFKGVFHLPKQNAYRTIIFIHFQDFCRMCHTFTFNNGMIIYFFSCKFIKMPISEHLYTFLYTQQQHSCYTSKTRIDKIL